MLKLKRLVSILLLIIICFSNVCVYAQEDEGANSRQASFMNFYANSEGLNLSMANLTVQDYYVLYAFMSNFFEPGRTTLAELETLDDNSAFFTSFTNALGMNDSGKTQLKEIIKNMAADTRKGIESGKGTILNNDGKRANGKDMLWSMRESLNVGRDGEEIGNIYSKKMYYGQKDDKHIAFDFSTPAVKAAFQTVCAYNPYVFLDYYGLYSIDALFLDAVGNVWAVECGSISDKVKDATNIRGLVSAVGPENVYILLPACLNPSTFTPNATKQEELRMPLMNRFVLGCMLNPEDLVMTVNGENVYSFNYYYMPFHNLFEHAGDMSNAAKALSVFGVQSISPFLMETGKNVGGTTEGTSGAFNGDSWSEDKRRQDVAFFMANPGLISAKTDSSNGIGHFATNSYIVFAPSMENITVGNGGINKDGVGNATLDTKEWRYGNNSAISVYCKKDSHGNFDDFADGGEDAQRRLIAYLYTPVKLDLNHVSMNFYLNTGVDNNSDTVFEDYAKYLYKYDNPEDIIASKMGMRGLSLFFSGQSDIWKLGKDDSEYRTFIPDKMIHSKFMESLASGTTSAEGNTAFFKEILNGNIQDGVISEDAEYVIEGILTCNKNGNFSTSKWGIGDFCFKKTDNEDVDEWDIYVMPRRFMNVGNNNVDVCISRTLGVGDKTMRGKVGILDNEIIKSDKNENIIMATVQSAKAKRVAVAMYGYSIFTPSDATLDAMTPENTLKEVYLFDGSKKDGAKAGIYLSSFANEHILMGSYFGYIIDMMGISSCDKDGLDFAGFSSIFLPNFDISAKGGEMGVLEEGENSGVLNSEDLSFEEKQKDLINRIYGITNDKNNDYRNNLIKNIIEGFVLTVHRTITGTWYSNIDSVSTGSGSTYQSVTGYVYTPTLEELSFTATLMNNYVKIYIVCFMIVLFMLVLMVLLNLRTWQQGMIIGFTMSIALLFPYILISNTVNISNKISDGIYSDRFDFWAMSQHQQSLISLESSVSMTEKDKLLTISTATMDSTRLGEPGVKIKWMSPKKVEMFQNLYSDKSLSDSFVTNMEIFKWLFNSLIYDSEFEDSDKNSTYLYRAYNSIATEARSYYGWGEELRKKSEYISKENYDYNGISYTGVPQAFVKTLDSFATETQGRYNSIYIGGLNRLNQEYYTNKMGYDTARIDDIKLVGQKDLMGSPSESDLIGIWGTLNEEITNRIVGDTSSGAVAGIGSNLPSLDDPDSFKDKDIRQIAKAIYLKNTESPYYYFYSVLKDRYGRNTGEFKKALLDNTIYKVSYDDAQTLNSNRKVVNKYRDFLDMEGLFTYIIPYMNAGNQYVINWQKENGSEVEEYNFAYTVDESGENPKKTDEALLGDGVYDYDAAVTQKNNMNRIWNMYCPWVDSLYELPYMNRKVTVAGKRQTVSNALNPSSYLEVGRPMIFSEADMEVKGYSYGDLTDIEKRIQAVTEKTYDDLLFLVNYYDMKDDVLIAAAAMYATFNFNTEFSENSFLGESSMLYPQGFELKNFNYDAFMRLALLNSTGESVFATEDLYSRVLAKTSLFTGLLLLICDLIACILIPMFKFVILVGLLFLGILVCIACVVNPPEKIFEAVCKSLLLPTMLFMVLNIAFSWAMSLVVGEGLTAYVGSKGINFATNDPTITMLIMAAMGCVYVFCAFKILKFLWSAYKQFGMSTALAAVGIVGAAITAGTAGIAKRATKALGKGVGAGVGMATADKGNRLAGAFEGARTGTRGVIDRRIQEKRMARMMGGGLPSGDGKSSSSTTNKINSLAKGKGTGSGKGKDSSSSTGGNPPSELKRKLTNDTDKNATKLGRMLGGLSYAGAVVGDKARAVKSGFKKVGTVMMHPVAAGSYAKGAITENFKSGVNKVTNYTKKSLKTYQDERAYNKFRNQERDKERMSGFNKKMATGAITHAVKKGAKAVAKRSIGM